MISYHSQTTTFVIRNKAMTKVRSEWILDHKKEVIDFTIKRNFGLGGVVLTARLKNGVYYISPLPSKEYAHRFIHRPSWQGIPVKWYSYSRVIPFEMSLAKK